MFQVVRASPSVSFRAELEQLGLWSLNSRRAILFQSSPHHSALQHQQVLVWEVSGETARMTTPGSRILALYLPWLDPGTVFKLNKEPNDKLGRGQHRPDLTTITGRVSDHYRWGKLLFGPELGNLIFSFRFPCSVTDSSTFLPASGMKCLENSEASTWSLLPAVTRFFEFSNSTKRMED